MAGIGFSIEKLLEKNTYLSVLKAHFYSIFICAGPWMISIIMVFSLQLFKPENIGMLEIFFFRTVIIYIYAFSLIVTGIIHLSVTRYLSDRLYSRQEEYIIPVFNTSFLAVIIIQTLTGLVIFTLPDISVTIRILILMNYLVISVTWVLMLFLTVLRDFRIISMSFIAGAAVTISGALLLGRSMGLTGYFIGFFLGHLLIVSLLGSRIFIEFSSKKLFDWDLFAFLKNNKLLVVTGIFYNAALWIDKIVYWVSDKSFSVKGFFHIYPHYESALFYAYLTIIPALSYFLVKVETDFYRYYKRYYAKIMQKGTFEEIKEAKDDMLLSLRINARKVIIFQGLVSLFVITFAQELIVVAHLQPIQIILFRVAVLAAFLHSLLFIALVIIMYFDFKWATFFVVLLYFFSNGLFTYASTFCDIRFEGYGYFISVLIALMAAYYILDSRFKKLEYLTFASQPIELRAEQ